MKRNKKKGFTLIVILAIIALIATPIILNVIDTAKNGAAESSALEYIDAVEKQVRINQVSGSNQITPNVYDKATLTTKKVEVKGGSDITDLKVKVDEKGQVTEGKFCINGKSIDYDGKKAEYNKEVDYCNGNVELEGGKTPSVAKKYTIVTDANSNGTADIGDEITIGTESFYVISNDGTNINALAKYNLNVGGEYNSSWTAYTAYTNPTGIQDSAMLGYVSGQTIIKGTRAFSSDSQKGTNYSDYSGSIVEGYVNEYETYLNTKNQGLNAKGRLILKEELESLGCSSSDYTCSNAPSWVYSTSYWSGSSNGASNVWFVFSGGHFHFNYFGSYGNRDGDYGCNSDRSFGVRPVITIAA